MYFMTTAVIESDAFWVSTTHSHKLWNVFDWIRFSFIENVNLVGAADVSERARRPRVES